MSRVTGRSPRSDVSLVVAALVGAALLAAALLLLVFVRVGQTRAGYDVHDLRAERSKLAQQRAALDVERASLLRPARLASWARAEAGLAPVDAARLLAPTPASVTALINAPVGAPVSAAASVARDRGAP